ncbi:cytochrome P450 704C1 [Amborella trichopoda]|uniref:Cytochrome P450 n=1 Tax=Amborella trichopoda TaxID=13333 RepID=U5DAA2_AMBTC|nr:cytochrome P450 704C1 [Amborella trichopoda]ERN19434.1 hypothetical protein AMTR_s00069p00176780 [Amborella trichopoda]|eukprot:XP_006857967.1 cytochrome P450 704C1 [Amborella trichopoda]
MTPVEASILLIASVIITVFICVILERRVWRYGAYPPVVGTVVHQLINFSTLHHFHLGHAQKHTTYRLLSPARGELYTVNPANLQHILKTNFANYGKGKYQHEVLKDLFGDGIFAVDGERWKTQRKLASYEFSTKVLREFSCKVFCKNAVKLAGKISEAAKSHLIMDIQDLLMKATMDSLFKVGFGLELNTLLGCEEENKFAKAFGELSAQLLRRFTNPLWKLERFLSLGPEAMLRKNIKFIDDFVYKIIQQKREQVSKEHDSLEKHRKEDILSRFLVESEKYHEKMSDKYLRDIILNFLIAGRDTTAGTLSWFFYLLCKHPHIQEKIAQEVRESVCTKNEGNVEGVTMSGFADALTEGALGRLQFLHAALAETLRLYPAVPVNAKVAFGDDVLPDGSKVRKGDMVNYLSYAMGRMTSIWGDDAYHFRPERWIQNGVFQPKTPFEFPAFQGGPRICLGKDFAYLQMKVMAAVLIRFFKFKLRDEEQEAHYHTMLTLHIDHGLHVYAFSQNI